VTTRHDLGGVLGWPLDTLDIGLSQFHGHNSWLVCEPSGPAKGCFTPRARATSPRGQLHEISTFLGLKADLNYTLE
jgi:hypothetical protein